MRTPVVLRVAVQAGRVFDRPVRMNGCAVCAQKRTRREPNALTARRLDQALDQILSALIARAEQTPLPVSPEPCRV